MKGSPLSVAVVGLGWVSLNRHIPQILRNPKLRLAGVIDRHSGRARSVAARIGAPRWTEAEDLSSVDWLHESAAVVVATSPFSHYRLVIAALEAGKHVLTEKPFAMNLEEGAKMVQAAKKHQRVLAVTHNFQFALGMRALRRDIERGAIGEIHSVTGSQLGNPARRLPIWYDRLPLGLFYDESPHLLYLLDCLARGPLEPSMIEIIPSLTGLNTPAQVNATFQEQGGGCPFVIRCNFEAPVSEWYLMVCGEKALAVVDLFRDIYLRLPNDGAHRSLGVIRTSLAATFGHWRQVFVRGAAHLAGRLYYGNDELYDRFADAVRGDVGRVEPISGERALRVLRLQHAIISEKNPTAAQR